jgi:PAS domain S-box-containing protein
MNPLSVRSKEHEREEKKERETETPTDESTLSIFFSTPRSSILENCKTKISDPTTYDELTTSFPKTTNSTESIWNPSPSPVGELMIVDSRKRGRARKKGTWGNSWKDVYIIITRGLLFEFKTKKSTKPNKVFDLSQYKVRLAEGLTGVPFSFGLFSPQQETIYFAVKSQTNAVAWVAACGQTTLAEWEPDEVLEALNDAVVMAAEDSIIIGVNEAALQMFGYTRGELMGNRIEILMTDANRRNHAQHVSRYLTTKDKRLIGKTRLFSAIDSAGKTFSVEISLGEIFSNGKHSFLARFHRVIDIEDPVTLNVAIQNRVDTQTRDFSQQLTKHLVEKMNFTLEEEITQRNNEIERLTLKLKKLQKKQKKIDKKMSKRSISDTSVIIRVGDCDDQRIISMKSVEMNERLAEGGSGATVYVCNVGGWQCICKELNLESVTPQQITKFESEGEWVGGGEVGEGEREREREREREKE